jgi:hypothetical protein
MTLSLMITLNIVLDVALLGGLAFVMSRASLLKPHKTGVTGNRWRIRRPVHHHVHAYARGERASLRQLNPAIDRG